MKLGEMLNDDELQGGVGGDRIPIGKHEVEISDYRMFVCRSGSPGVEYEVIDCVGRKHSVSFVMKPGNKGNLQSLNSWLSALGFSKEERADFDPDIDRHQAKLIGRHVLIEVIKPETSKHTKVKSWAWEPVEQLKTEPPNPKPDDDMPF